MSPGRQTYNRLVRSIDPFTFRARYGTHPAWLACVASRRARAAGAVGFALYLHREAVTR
jgi:hypothetical protein